MGEGTEHAAGTPAEASQQKNHNSKQQQTSLSTAKKLGPALASLALKRGI
jgi:hypothetical protein